MEDQFLDNKSGFSALFGSGTCIIGGFQAGKTPPGRHTSPTFRLNHSGGVRRNRSVVARLGSHLIDPILRLQGYAHHIFQSSSITARTTPRDLLKGARMKRLCNPHGRPGP